MGGTFRERIQQQISADRSRRQRLQVEFKERTVESHTLGDLIGAVLSIDNAYDARDFYEGLVEYYSSLPLGAIKRSADEVARSNIGWCFGEGMAAARRAMWREVCDAAHPVFGAMETSPTPEEALQAGIEMARAEGQVQL